MEVDIEGGIKVKVDTVLKTAEVIKIPDEADTLIIPRYAKYKNKKYKITSICLGKNSCHIKFLTFPKDSEIETFGKSCFYGSTINKLTIPPKLNKLVEGWCAFLHDLYNIEVSPKKPNFIYYNNTYLLGKSYSYKDNFDALYFTRHRKCSHSFSNQNFKKRFTWIHL